MTMDDEVRTRFHALQASVEQTATQLAVLVVQRANDRKDIDEMKVEAKEEFTKMQERLGKIYTALLGVLVSVVTLVLTLWLQELRTP